MANMDIETLENSFVPFKSIPNIFSHTFPHISTYFPIIFPMKIANHLGDPTFPLPVAPLGLPFPGLLQRWPWRYDSGSQLRVISLAPKWHWRKENNFKPSPQNYETTRLISDG